MADLCFLTNTEEIQDDNMIFVSPSLDSKDFESKTVLKNIL